MVAPLVAAALIGGGATLIGGAIANRSARRQAEQNEALQREFAQQGIRWKVQDARAAGLHPLYAIGASGAAYSPTTYNDSMGPAIAQAGEYGARAIQGQVQRNDRKQAAHLDRQIQRDQIILGQQRLQSQIRVDETQAQLNQALAAQALRQPSSGMGGTAALSPSGAVVDTRTAEGQAQISAAEGHVQLVPTEQQSYMPGHPESVAGLHSMFRKHRVFTIPGVGSLDTYILNADTPAEAFEGIGATALSSAATLAYWTFGGIPKTLDNAQKLYGWYQTKIGQPLANKAFRAVTEAQKKRSRPLPKTTKIR